MKFRLFSLFTICEIVSLASPIRELSALRGIDFSSSFFEPTIVEVQYLESTGTQYMLFEGAVVNGIEIGVLPPSTRQSYGACGNWNGGSRVNTIKIDSRDGTWYVANDANNGVSQINEPVVFSYVTIHGKEVMMNGNVYTMGKEWNAQYKYRKFALWGTWRNDQDIVACTVCRIGRCRLYSGDLLLYDLVPIRFRNESGRREGAMFDMLSNTLFRNHGSGAFLIGPDAEGEE